MNLIKILIVSGFLLAAMALFQPNGASAQEPETVEIDTTQQTDGDQNQTLVPEKYSYTVVSGDNMTVLVRRSVMLYDEADDSFQLNDSQIVATETKIVNEMGPREIDIGQLFEVPTDLIEKYVPQAQQLSEAQQSAWGNYSQFATFQINDVKPDNVPLTDDGSLDKTASQVTVTTDDTTETQQDDDDASAIWWVIAVIAIAAVVIILWPRQQSKK